MNMPVRVSRIAWILCSVSLVCAWSQAANAQTVVGADPTGGSDSSAAFNTATSNLQNVHVLTIPPGKYRLDSPWVIKNVGAMTHNVRISGYGVEFVPRSDPPELHPVTQQIVK